jgi:hypothetical protein
MHQQTTNLIPKILHAIWLGSEPRPFDNCKNLENWQQEHPAWEVRVWRDQDVAKFLSTLGDWRIAKMMQSVGSYAAKSDILRLVILREMGGVYIDGDMEIVKPIDPILDMVSTGCFVGWEQNYERINNAVIGAAPYHPAVCDAINALRVHMQDHRTLLKGAAHATGPFFLTDVWRKDNRVTKLPKECFYPYDWHEPWRANHTLGPDTYAVHRWDASWVDEMRISKREVPTMAVCIIGTTDPGRKALTWGSHLDQTIEAPLSAYEQQDLDSLKYPSRLYNMLYSLVARRIHRILFVPADHVLDQNLLETHALLPENTIGVTQARLYSSLKLFPLEFRKAKAFPFDVFKFHGLEMPLHITSSFADVGEVFSVPVQVALAVNDQKRIAMKMAETWHAYAQDFVYGAEQRARCCFTYNTRTTKLCQHPVNETVGTPHVDQWDGKKINRQ